MICYRDRAWCSAPCANHECNRCVTPEVEAEVKKWDLPLALMDMRCTNFIQREDKP